MPFLVFKNLFFVFDKTHKFYIFFIFFIFFLLMLLELFSITLFIPLIAFVLENNIEENKFFTFFRDNFNLDLYFLVGNLKNFIIFFFITFLIKSLLVIYCNWHKIGFTYKIRKYLTHNIYKKYINIPYENFIKQNSATYLKNINYEINQVSIGLIQTLQFFSELIIIFGIGIFLMLYDFKVSSLVLILSSVFIFLISIITKKKMFNLGEKVRVSEQSRIKNYIESFNLIKEIKIYNKQNFFVNRDLDFTSNFLQTDFLFRFIKSIPTVLVELLLIIIMLTLILINIDVKSTNHILELLGVFAASGFRLMPSSKRIVSSIQSLRYALPSINNILKEFPKTDVFYQKDNHKTKIKVFEKEIKMFDLSFKYLNQENYVFQNLNLKIKKGEIVGIKGKTGSGKTTIVNLILGLISPSEGSILIDEHNFKDTNIKSIQNLIGYVPQNIYLMDASIRDNISFFSDEISMKSIEDSLDKANLSKFINQSKDGLSTKIGEKNNKISGGQAQRIGIARALAKKPEILILDEATNALDTFTENEILKGVSNLKGELTIIMISHDQNSLRICDKIIDLDNLKNQ